MVREQFGEDGGNAEAIWTREGTNQPGGLAERSRGLSVAIPPAGGLMNCGTLEECQTGAENNCK